MACCCDSSPNCECAQCADDTQPSRHPVISASGFSGDCSQFNGNHAVTYAPSRGCYWSAPVGTGEIRVYYGAEGVICGGGFNCLHAKFLSPGSTVLYTKSNDAYGRSRMQCAGDGTSGTWSTFEYDSSTGTGCTAHPATVTFKPNATDCEECCCMNRDMPSSITLTMSSACAQLNLGSVTMNIYQCLQSGLGIYQYHTAGLDLYLSCTSACTGLPSAFHLLMYCNGGALSSGEGCCTAAPNCQPFSGSGTLTVYAGPDCCTGGQTASFSFHE